MENSFIPQSSVALVDDAIFTANRCLDHLRSLMAEHGEGAEELKTYIQNGAEYRIRERKAEINAWMEANNMPHYARRRYLEDAIADLGADNVDYWKSLGKAMVVRYGNSSISPIIDLANDVDYSEDGWRVSEAYRAERLRKVTVAIPDWMADDMKDIQAAIDAIDGLYRRGYDLEDVMRWFVEFGKRIEVHPEDVYNSYCSARDERQKNEEKIF